jgi:hypothetical protein
MRSALRRIDPQQRNCSSLVVVGQHSAAAVLRVLDRLEDDLVLVPLHQEHPPDDDVLRRVAGHPLVGNSVPPTDRTVGVRRAGVLGARLQVPRTREIGLRDPRPRPAGAPLGPAVVLVGHKLAGSADIVDAQVCRIHLGELRHLEAGRRLSRHGVDRLGGSECPAEDCHHQRCAQHQWKNHSAEHARSFLPVVGRTR